MRCILQYTMTHFSPQMFTVSLLAPVDSLCLTFVFVFFLSHNHDSWCEKALCRFICTSPPKPVSTALHQPAGTRLINKTNTKLTWLEETASTVLTHLPFAPGLPMPYWFHWEVRNPLPPKPPLFSLSPLASVSILFSEGEDSVNTEEA